MNNLYNLETFFSQVEQTITISELSQKQKKFLMGEMEKYREALHKNNDFYSRDTKTEKYTHCFPLYGSDNYYNVAWDIESAKEFIQKHKIQSQLFLTKELWQNVDPSRIDWNKVYTPVTWVQEPIVVAYMDSLNAELVIDGNHRLARAMMADPSGTIEGYFLEPDDHQKVMAGELFRVLYKILHNVTIIVNYCSGAVPKIRMADRYDRRYGACFLYPMNSRKQTLVERTKTAVEAFFAKLNC